MILTHNGSVKIFLSRDERICAPLKKNFPFSSRKERRERNKIKRALNNITTMNEWTYIREEDDEEMRDTRILHTAKRLK